MASMGVSRDALPSWDDIQILTAQLGKLPLLDDARVGSDVVIGPNAQKPSRTCLSARFRNLLNAPWRKAQNWLGRASALVRAV